METITVAEEELTTMKYVNATPEFTDVEINSFFFYETIQFTVLWILFLSIVLGNGAVLVALSFNKARKNRMNFFIMHLALADLLVGLVSVMIDMIWRTTVTWSAGPIACKVVKYLQVVVTYSSTYVLVALSIDRYDAITHPMNFSSSCKQRKRTKQNFFNKKLFYFHTFSGRRARALIGCAWILSFVFAVPSVFINEEKIIEGRTQCWIEMSPWQWKLYLSIVATTVFVVPAIVISGCYAIIVYTIWSKSKLLSPAKNNTLQRGAKKPEEHDIRRSSSRGIIPKAKIKTVKMTFVIVFVFILCWSPYIVFDLLQVYGYIPKTQSSVALATFIQSLAPLNSAANPIIYCLFSTHICRSLRQVPPFRWLWCCRNGTQEQLSYTETLTSSNRQVNTSLLRNATVHVHSVVRAPVLDRMGISTEKNSYADSLL
ncbi:cardioacceleratory peptide receptor isoform X1 [Rhopalosiphum padi]|uniref:cardioacceleratory peptide receptor isoform X1 n=1 Tax=Rhopalosiphum padi TaxID=40932 RepID=UPI00298D99DE|nr:cardioacceleratory peptide receptor isoform X1 [Rhopalosiphum padi]XP_060850561.1 cardioacceleratory peptide receptor isoform X1 [Rhopalosiphum padi]XP_060850562.1 cardioacceleratory peptide receptor isoform X1 [Rhopalosiphum padi]XP_060850563.1 cardioacceleratory peptide receptor isoform X1 [Rhopalosiphum padi]XP_060850564.1 cardioacceleratory peptide receptor isoform X1 [Rhopalosiphum padi]XP_060850565.1 cardioacceleratory peptide receptor isoform X1 [Rhopalosiphum padi]XP_060850566.1 ca